MKKKVPARKIVHFSKEGVPICGNPGRVGSRINCPDCLEKLNVTQISVAEFVEACNAVGVVPGPILERAATGGGEIPKKVLEYLDRRKADKGKIIKFPGPSEPEQA